MIETIILNATQNIGTLIPILATVIYFFDKRIKRNEQKTEELEKYMEEIKIELAEIKQDVKWIVKMLNGEKN